MALAENKDSDGKQYLFRRCPTCGVKLHVSAYFCWKCGKRYDYDANTGKFVNDVIYGSDNPNDKIYNLQMNNVDRCMTCRNTQNNKMCHHTYCFGSGKGNCELCNRLDSVRFDCCQDMQKKDVQNYELIKQALKKSTQPLNNKNAKSA